MCDFNIFSIIHVFRAMEVIALVVIRFPLCKRSHPTYPFSECQRKSWLNLEFPSFRFCCFNVWAYRKWFEAVFSELFAASDLKLHAEKKNSFIIYYVEMEWISWTKNGTRKFQFWWNSGRHMEIFGMEMEPTKKTIWNVFYYLQCMIFRKYSVAMLSGGNVSGMCNGKTEY